MEQLKKVAIKLVESNNYSPAMKDALSLITKGEVSFLDLKNCLLKHTVSIDELKSESLSVVIDYARICLQDGILTEEEIHNITLLKMFLRIQEGEFYEQRKEDINAVLSQQLNKMYNDNVIDKNEALMKTDLQGLFNLSYDQFLEIVNKIALDALDRGADIKDLDTYM